MLTLKDVDLLKQFFMTKEDFDNARKELNSDLLTFKDDIITEIKDLRQETEINSSFRDKIENQDRRIYHLETSIFN